MLAGDAIYEGKLEHKETLGNDIKKPESDDIKKSIKILYLTSLLWVLIFCLIKLLVWSLIKWS